MRLSKFLLLNKLIIQQFRIDYGNQQPYASQEYAPSPKMQETNYQFNNTPSYPAGTPQPPQIGGVFGQPMVQDMAYQYGQQVNRK